MGINLAQDILEYIPRMVATPKRTFWQKKLMGKSAKAKSNSMIHTSQKVFRPSSSEFNHVSDL